MSATEQELRVQLAACYRIFDYLGWDELIYNHITVKIPGDQEHFLINPYGLHYNEVKASNLVKVDIHGTIIDETPYQPNPAGMVIHSAIHGARKDVACVGHIHSDAGMTVACQKDGLRTDNFYSVLLWNQVAYHDFEGITVDEGEKTRLVSNLGDKDLLILRNHGLLSCGNSIPAMFLNLWGLQRACEIQVLSDASGKALTPVGQDIADRSAQLLKMQMGAGSYGELEFNAMLRQIDLVDSSYKE